MSNFLQSSAWQSFQEARGLKTFRHSGQGWSYLAIKETGPGHSRLYLPYGPICDSHDSFLAAFADLKRLALTEKSAFIRLDSPIGPDQDSLQSLGGRPVNYLQLQPADTLLIDLSLPQDQLLAQMSQNSRNVTRNYQNKGVSVRASHNPDEISILIDLLDGVARHNHITTHSADYFHVQSETFFPTGAATLYIADYNSSPIAAALVYDSDDTRTYAHAAADFNFRKLNAGTALVGQMILDAKAKGLKWVDLYGVSPDDSPNHPWAGFSKFKRSFGGSHVHRLGTWDFPIKWLPYFIYSTYQRFRQQIKRFR